MTPPTGGRSSKRNLRLAQLVQEWADQHDFVGFDSNGGFRLPDTSIVAPDAAFVTRAAWEHLSENDQEGFVPLVPEIAIELRSKSDSADDLRAKLLRLRSLGTAYVILIDPYAGDIWTDGVPPENFDIPLSRLLKE